MCGLLGGQTTPEWNVRGHSFITSEGASVALGECDSTVTATPTGTPFLA